MSINGNDNNNTNNYNSKSWKIHCVDMRQLSPLYNGFSFIYSMYIHLQYNFYYHA